MKRAHQTKSNVGHSIAAVRIKRQNGKRGKKRPSQIFPFNLSTIGNATHRVIVGVGHQQQQPQSRQPSESKCKDKTQTPIETSGKEIVGACE